MPKVIEVNLATGENTSRQMTNEEIEAIQNPSKADLINEKKAIRGIDVSKILVTTSFGNTFDGNEDAQNRMARALVGMEEYDSIHWVLSDNSIVNVTKAELREALRVAGQRQAELWIIPYK